MDSSEIRKLIFDALDKCEGVEKVLPLGNTVFTYAGDQEYEIVIKTVREKRWLDDKQYNGPVAQE